ncbi:hypothetical protein ACGFZB_24655 [Streptomyces cinerochromogenes]|uniref:Uncharacterized protein n=1 Tax=Streptomyces cinerochromogenes TaxID=66422 RepID=A0ABW7B8R9_9ACTN
MTAIAIIAAENSVSGPCHNRHGAGDHHDGSDREDGREEDMATPLRMDSDTIRYPIGPLSMMGGGPARTGAVCRTTAKE